MGLKLLDQLGDYVVFVHPALELLREICLEFGSPQCCIWSLGSSAPRFVFHKMILLLALLDLVIHIANLL